MKRYIVLVSECACRDGQVVDAFYAEFDKEGELVEGTEDWRDFNGEFSLGIFNGETEEDTLKDVSSTYDIPVESLVIHELA